ncbi:alpha/beta fold hydrolase [Filimonas effusa]|uniref:Alpha/beta fold hydrolase n=1 Tax=Filimonas effusa TaxID=2508721 RepID=A0A4Q1DBG7_9BACT|nr:alpha/beta fold hydrolase [Filimonas effusa]RXK86125.1 alpha/beta fold hydrolase [Filimonas effusa]
MKTSLLMLHGAIGASCQLKAIAGELSERYDVHLLDFPGHGGEALPAESFSIPLFADAARNYIQDHNLVQPMVFGYSMGGYVAMYLASRHPELLSRIVTLGTKFHWNETSAAREVKMLDPAVIAEKVPAFAAALKTMHAPNDWKQVLHNTADMLLNMGRDNLLTPADFQNIKLPCLLMQGDRDKMVTFDETIATYKKLPDARLAVLPNTPHPMEQVNPSLIAYLIK